MNVLTLYFVTYMLSILLPCRRILILNFIPSVGKLF